MDAGCACGPEEDTGSSFDGNRGLDRRRSSASLRAWVSGIYMPPMNARLPVAIAALVLFSSGCSIQIGTIPRPMNPQRLEDVPGRPPQMDRGVRQQVVQRQTMEIREGGERRGPGQGPGPMEGGSGENLQLQVRAHPVPEHPGTYRLHASVERHSSGRSHGEASEEHDHMDLPPLEASVGGEATTQAGSLRLTFKVVEESGRTVGAYELSWKSPNGEGLMRSGRLPLDASGRPEAPKGKPRRERGPKPGKDGPGS